MKLPLQFNKYGDNEVYQYSQIVDQEAYNRCFRFSAFIACASLMNKDPGQQGLRDFLNYYLDKGENPKYGGSIEGGTRETLEFRNNKYPDHKCKSRMVFGRNSQEHRIAVNRGLPCIYSIQVGDKFREDRQKGKITRLDYTATGPKDKRVGHSIMGYKKQEDRKIYLCDSSNNYINQYELPSLARMDQVKGLFKSQNVMIIEPA